MHASYQALSLVPVEHADTEPLQSSSSHPQTAPPTRAAFPAHLHDADVLLEIDHAMAAAQRVQHLGSRRLRRQLHEAVGVGAGCPRLMRVLQRLRGIVVDGAVLPGAADGLQRREDGGQQPVGGGGRKGRQILASPAEQGSSRPQTLPPRTWVRPYCCRRRGCTSEKMSGLGAPAAAQ